MMFIRRALPEDIDRIHELHTASIRRLCGQAYRRDKVDQWVAPLTPERYLNAMEQFDFHVGEAERVIGFTIFSPVQCELYAMYLDPDETGKGYGRKLMDHVELLARAHGVITLKLKSTLNAEGFYTACGFEKVRDTIHINPMGLELPCVEMIKLL